MVKNKIISLLKGKKAAKIAIIAGICGILLIFLSDYIPQSEDKETNVSTVQDTLNGYSQAFESKLKNICKKITGGNCDVMVTMEQGSEYIYAAEQKNSSDYSEESKEGGKEVNGKSNGEKKYVILDEDGKEDGLLVTEIAPKVKGVVIVCETSDPSRASAVRKAASTVLDISEENVCVVSGVK